MSDPGGFNNGQPEHNLVKDFVDRRTLEVEGCAGFLRVRTGLSMREARAVMAAAFDAEAVTAETFTSWIDSEFPLPE